MQSLWEVLKTSKGLPAPDGFTALFARSLSDTYTLAEISGIPPLNIGGIVEIVDYTIKGNTYQSDGVSPDTLQEVVGVGERTGNLFDNGNTEDIIKSTYINQNGELVTSAAYYMSYPIKVIGGASYTWSFDTITNAEHTAPTVAFYDSDDSLISVATHRDRIKWFSFSAPENCKYVRGSVYIGQGNNTSMLLNGERSGNANYPLPYEPYGYKVDVVTRGKNLFDFNSATFPLLGHGGVVTTSDKTVKYTLSEGADNYGFLVCDTVLSKGNYTIFADVVDNRVLKPVYGYGFRVHVDGNFIDIISTKKSFTISAEMSTVKICFYVGMPNTGGGYVEVSNIQLEAGTEATSYEPYTPPITTPIYLDSPLYKIGDYADVRGMTEEVRRIGVVDLGTLTYTKSSTSGNFTSVETLPNARKISNTDTGNAICSAFKEVQASQVTNIPYSFSSTLNSSSRVYINGTGFENMTAEDFKTAMSGVYVYYVLAEPETKVVEAVEIPTLNGTTVIDVDTEVKPSNLKITYKSRR